MPSVSGRVVLASCGRQDPILDFCPPSRHARLAPSSSGSGGTLILVQRQWEETDSKTSGKRSLSSSSFSGSSGSLMQNEEGESSRSEDEPGEKGKRDRKGPVVERRISLDSTCQAAIIPVGQLPGIVGGSGPALCIATAEGRLYMLRGRTELQWSETDATRWFNAIAAIGVCVEPKGRITSELVGIFERFRLPWLASAVAPGDRIVLNEEPEAGQASDPGGSIAASDALRLSNDLINTALMIFSEFSPLLPGENRACGGDGESRNSGLFLAGARSRPLDPFFASIMDAPLYTSRFLPLCRLLRYCDLAGLGSNESRIAFYSNVYHALLLHACATSWKTVVEADEIRDKTALGRHELSRRCCYIVGGTLINLLTVSRLLLWTADMEEQIELVELGCPAAPASPDTSMRRFRLATRDEVPVFPFSVALATMSKSTLPVTPLESSVRALTDALALNVQFSVYWDDKRKVVRVPIFILPIVRFLCRDASIAMTSLASRLLFGMSSLLPRHSVKKQEILQRAELGYSVHFVDAAPDCFFFPGSAIGAQFSEVSLSAVLICTHVLVGSDADACRLIAGDSVAAINGAPFAAPSGKGPTAEFVRALAQARKSDSLSVMIHRHTIRQEVVTSFSLPLGAAEYHVVVGTPSLVSARRSTSVLPITVVSKERSATAPLDLRSSGESFIREDSSALLKDAGILAAVLDPKTGVPLKDRRYRLRTFRQCFVASEIVAWMVGKGYCDAPSVAERKLMSWHDSGLFVHVVDRSSPFRMGDFFYRWTISREDVQTSLESQHAAVVVQQGQAQAHQTRSLDRAALQNAATRVSRADMIIALLGQNNGLKIKSRTYRLRVFSNCFKGKALVDWILRFQPSLGSRGMAVAVGNELRELGVFEHVVDQNKPLMDEALFYRFCNIFEDDNLSPAKKQERDNILREIREFKGVRSPDLFNTDSHYAHSRKNSVSSFTARVSVDQSLVAASFINCDLETSAFIEVCNAVASSQQIQAVDIIGNPRVGDAGARALADLISSNAIFVRSLRLTDNGFTVLGVLSLVKSLADNASIVLFDASEDISIGGIILRGHRSPAIEAEVARAINSLRRNRRLFRELESPSSTTLRVKGIGFRVIMPALYERLALSSDTVSAITTLDLSANSIGNSAFETVCSYAQFLKTLDLSNNAIREVGSSISRLKQLSTLILTNNELLTAVSSATLDLTDIQVLDFSGCRKIVSLPIRGLSVLSSMAILRVEPSAPVWQTESVPRMIADASLSGNGDSILRYLRSLQEGSQRTLRLKLVVLGLPKSGKSNLLNSIIRSTDTGKAWHNAAALAASSTKQIRIHEWQPDFEDLRNPDEITQQVIDGTDEGSSAGANKLIQVTAWDVPGDDIFLIAQDMFFSPRALHVITVDLRSVNADELHIAGLLESLCGRAARQSAAQRTPAIPVVLVGTHSDSAANKKQAIRDFEQLAGRLEQKFPGSLKAMLTFGAVASDKSSSKAAAAVRSALLTTASELDFVREQVPGAYWELEKLILKERVSRTPPVMSINDFSELARTTLQSENTSADTSVDAIQAALRFLHDRGAVVYFGFEEGVDPKLGSWLVLDMEWLTSCVSRILMAPSVMSSGILQHAELPQILFGLGSTPQEFLSVEICDKLLRALTKFEVLYHAGDSSQSLVPHLLAPNIEQFQLRQVWPEVSTLGNKRTRFVRLYSFLFTPLTFFSKLMVRILSSVQGIAGVQTSYWRYGIILAVPSTKEEVGVFFDLESRQLRCEFRVRSEDTRKAVSRAVLDGVKAFIAALPNGSETECRVACEHCRRSLSKTPRRDTIRKGSFSSTSTSHAITGKARSATELSALSLVMDEAYFNFDLKELERAVADGEIFMHCGENGEQLVRISSIDFDVAGVSEVAAGLIVDIGDVEFGEVLGRGGFATVYKATINQRSRASRDRALTTESAPDISLLDDQDANGGVFAVKRLNFLEDADAMVAAGEVLDVEEQREAAALALEEFRREVFTMAQLHHPNLVALCGVCLKPFLMVTELMPAGDLFRFVREHDPLPWRARFQIARDIALGMNFLHSATPPIVHRDLKSPNVLMATHDLTAPLLAKVSDFGLSTRAAPMMNKREVDTPYWLAPEILLNQDYGPPADVYSYGVILWELMTAADPFAEFDIGFMSVLEDKIAKEDLRPTIPGCDDEAYRQHYLLFVQLIENCWAAVPNARPSFEDALAVVEE